MATVVMLPSGRFRAFARCRGMKDAQVFDREKDAKTWADATQRRMKAGTWTPPAKEQEKGLTVRDAFVLYRSSEAWLEKEEGTTRKVETHKQKPVISALGDKWLTDLVEDDVEGYIAKRRKERPQRSKDPSAVMSGTSVRLEVLALSSMLNWAVDKKYVKTNVARHVKKPKGNRRTTRLADEVMGAILEKDPILMDLTAYTFFRILFTTGCRPGELTHSSKSNLRPNPPQLFFPKTKNGDERTIVIPMNIYELIEDHLAQQPKDCPYLFGTKKLSKEGWSPYNYSVPWKKALQLARDLGQAPADVQLVPYLARHEVISRLFERTKLNDGQIAGISGHRSAQALWHYKHLRNEHNRSVVESIDDMMTDIINRAISPSHPSQGLKIGEMLTDKRPRSRQKRGDIEKHGDDGFVDTK